MDNCVNYLRVTCANVCTGLSYTDRYKLTCVILGHVVPASTLFKYIVIVNSRAKP